ncbi:MAG: CRISPR-associated DxTHG motif protein [Thermocladium sp.]
MNNKVKTLYIAAWGNPLTWGKTTYKCDNDEEKQGYSSIVCEQSNIDKYIIFVLDSIITASVDIGENRPYNNEAVELLYMINGIRISNNNNRISVEPKIFEEKSWRNAINEYVRGLVSRIMPNFSDEKLDLIITPALGKLGGWTYDGRYEFIQIKLLGDLWGSLEKLYDSEIKNLDIILDLTHGINFMPSLMIYVARLAASLALLKGSKTVTIKAYNAISSGQQYEYVKVFSEQLRYVVLPDDPKDSVVKAFMKGMPLAVYKLCRKHDDQLKPNIKMDIDKNNKIINYSCNVKFIKYYEYLLRSQICSKATNKLNNLMKSDLFSKIGYVVDRLVINELNNLYKAIHDNEINGRIKYRDIRKNRQEEENRPDIENQDVFERNAVAHAGLLDEYTYIEKCEDDYCIDVDKEMLKKLSLSNDD